MKRIKRETEAIIKRADFLRSLLKEFGARLGGFDPGVTAFLPEGGMRVGYAGEHLDFTHTEWKWLEPILIELREKRKAK